MVDDSYYITPHETALAVVATGMKKARLRLDTLIVNSTMGGILFSAGGMLYLYSKAENPSLNASNPGIVEFLGSITYSIGLFYVVINGADLFNSNILFFSVGFFRNAVTFYDLLISWSISWLFNLGGTLFMCYVICYLSGVATAENMVMGSKEIVDYKASFTFIQTFIKGIAGNFCVCLAVYLQLMAKPLHVKYILMTLPIFTFVAMGFTHVVADMYLIPMGMINGHDLTVKTYIWKLLIPATLGNIVGGVFFSLVIPFYLHLVVVEMDRKKLELPEYEARDEQPELNMDSRVVRTKPVSFEEELEEIKELDRDPAEKEESGTDSLGTSSTYTNQGRAGWETRDYYPDNSDNDAVSTSNLRRITTSASSRSTNKKNLRSPAGVFPVKGMGEPLLRERTIVDPTFAEKVQSALSAENSRNSKSNSIQDYDGYSNYAPDDNDYDRASPYLNNESITSFDLMANNSDVDSSHEENSHLQPVGTKASSNVQRKISRVETVEDFEKEELKKYKDEGRYDVNDKKLGARLERALTHITTKNTSSKNNLHKDRVSKKNTESPILPLTTQDSKKLTMTTVPPEIEITPSPSIQKPKPALLSSLKKSFTKSPNAENVEQLHRRLSEAGITQRAARASDNIAGLENFQDIVLPVSNSPFHTSRRSSMTTTNSGSVRPQEFNSRTSIYSQSVKNNNSSNLKNVVFYDNDNMEEQSIAD